MSVPVHCLHVHTTWGKNTLSPQLPATANITHSFVLVDNTPLFRYMSAYTHRGLSKYCWICISYSQNPWFVYIYVESSGKDWKLSESMRTICYICIWMRLCVIALEMHVCLCINSIYSYILSINAVKWESDDCSAKDQTAGRKQNKTKKTHIAKVGQQPGMLGLMTPWANRCPSRRTEARNIVLREEKCVKESEKRREEVIKNTHGSLR